MSRPQIGVTLVAFCLLKNACILYVEGVPTIPALYECSQPLVVGAAVIRNSKMEFAMYDLLRASCYASTYACV
jgi:hypothetical protein